MVIYIESTSKDVSSSQFPFRNSGTLMLECPPIKDNSIEYTCFLFLCKWISLRTADVQQFEIKKPDSSILTYSTTGSLLFTVVDDYKISFPFIADIPGDYTV